MLGVIDTRQRRRQLHHCRPRPGAAARGPRASTSGSSPARGHDAGPCGRATSPRAKAARPPLLAASGSPSVEVEQTALAHPVQSLDEDQAKRRRATWSSTGSSTTIAIRRRQRLLRQRSSAATDNDSRCACEHTIQVLGPDLRTAPRRSSACSRLQCRLSPCAATVTVMTSRPWIRSRTKGAEHWHTVHGTQRRWGRLWASGPTKKVHEGAEDDARS